jgi:hypothetical protein
MSFYHNLITQKSFEELKKLRQTTDFILIGGWAVYFYTHQLKSKDIDIITDYAQLEKIGRNYQLTKNERLKKYEARRDEVQIDIYLPFYSNLGIPVEVLQKQTQTVENFTLLEANYLTALKIHTFNQRGQIPKGQKDFLDVVSLLTSPWVDKKKVKEVVKKYQIKTDLWEKRAKETNQIPELNLNTHRWARIKRQKGLCRGK